MTTRRRIASAEVVLRLVLVLLVPTLLPRVFFADPHHYWNVAREIRPLRAPSLHWLPYRGVFWEYPPITLPLLGLERLAQGSFVLYRALVGGVMIGCELGSLAMLRRASPERWVALTVAWNLTVLPVAVLAWYRIDFIAVLFATMALITIVRRPRGGAGAIAAGFASKLWPILLVVTLGRRGRWRDLVIAVTGSAAVLAGWIAWSPTGFAKFLTFRTADSMELESLPGGFALLVHHAPVRVQSGTWVLLGEGGARTQQVLYLVLLGIVLLCWMRGRRRGTDMVAFSGALTMAAMLCSWILSPQYLVWAAPFVVMVAADGGRRVAWWYGGATTLTFLYLLRFTSWYAVRDATHTSALPAMVLVARNLLLVAVLVEFILAIRPADPVTTAPAGRPPSPPKGRETGARQAGTSR